MFRARLRPRVDRLTRLALYAAAMAWRALLFRTTFIAITGSTGKTTAKECLAAMLGSEACTFRSPGTANSAVKVARAMLSVRPWHRFAVFEVGAFSPGWIKRTGGIVRPDIAVVLSVSAVHTNRFETIEDIAKEKASLLDCISRGGTAILNGDDPRVAAMAPPTGRRTLRFHSSDATHVEADWPRRLAFTFDGRRIQTKLVGRHWLPSVLGALHAARVCGVSFAGTVDAEPGLARMQPLELPVGATVIRDDFNGSAAALEAALDAMSDARAQRKILVISTVFDLAEKSIRRRADWLGRRVARRFDEILFVGAEPNRARRAAIEEGHPSDRVFAAKAVDEAAALLKQRLTAGDLVLLRDDASTKAARVLHHLTGPVYCTLAPCPTPALMCDDCRLLRANPLAGTSQ
jgi:UDP-N-acetylmuramoyl-tripeptide--D-alanyl-D-alanine ligase